MLISLNKVLAYLGTVGDRPPGEKLLLIYFIDSLADNPGGLIQGSAKLLGGIMGINRRSFQRHTTNLKKRGILIVHRTKYKGRIGPNRYELPGWAEFNNLYKEKP